LVGAFVPRPQDEAYAYNTYSPAYCNSALAIQGRPRHTCAMARAAQKPVAGYSYAEVEGALGTLFGVPANAQGSFRGRVRHFQRIGLVEVAPGRGRRIWYTRVQAGEWMLALYLAELGVDPVVIVKSIQRERTQLREWIAEATDAQALGGDEVFLAARPALMSGSWASKQSAGVLRFGKFRRGDWALKSPRLSPPPTSGRPPLKPAALGLIASPLAGGPQSAGPTDHLDAKDFEGSPPDLGTPVLREIKVLDWADPLLVVINLTGPVRLLGAALDSAPGD
jgi:hypothetical protein